MMKRKLNTNHMSSSGLRGNLCHAQPDRASSRNKALYTAGSPIKWGMTSFFAYTGMILLALSFSLSSFAYTSCVGGSIVTRNEYGSAPEGVECTDSTCPVHGENESPKTFCKSDKAMNWWTAYAWCKSNGGMLASFESMCPRIPAVNNSICPALQKKGGNVYVWSILANNINNNNAFCVMLSTGSIVNGTNRSGSNYALCE